MDEKLNSLIVKILAGDTALYEQVVKTHQAMVTSYAAFRLPEADLVDEVVQQTFVRAFETLGEFDTSADFGTWLRVICNYFILTERKRAAEQTRNLTGYRDQLRHKLIVASETRPADADTDKAEELEKLRRCREALPENAKNLVAYRYDEELRVDVIAQLVGKTPTWAASTLFRIRAALRKCIEGRARPEVV